MLIGFYLHFKMEGVLMTLIYGIDRILALSYRIDWIR